MNAASYGGRMRTRRRRGRVGWVFLSGGCPGAWVVIVSNVASGRVKRRAFGCWWEAVAAVCGTAEELGGGL